MFYNKIIMVWKDFFRICSGIERKREKERWSDVLTRINQYNLNKL